VQPTISVVSQLTRRQIEGHVSVGPHGLLGGGDSRNTVVVSVTLQHDAIGAARESSNARINRVRRRLRFMRSGYV
jgi:hypothetical protein